MQEKEMKTKIKVVDMSDIDQAEKRYREIVIMRNKKGQQLSLEEKKMLDLELKAIYKKHFAIDFKKFFGRSENETKKKE